MNSTEAHMWPRSLPISSQRAWKTGMMAEEQGSGTDRVEQFTFIGEHRLQVSIPEWCWEMRLTFLNLPHLSTAKFNLFIYYLSTVCGFKHFSISKRSLFNKNQTQCAFDQHICPGMPVHQDNIILLSPSPQWLPSTFQFWGIFRLAMASATRRSIAQRELSWPRLKRLLSSLWSVEVRWCPWITRCSARSWE